MKENETSTNPSPAFLFELQGYRVLVLALPLTHHDLGQVTWSPSPEHLEHSAKIVAGGSAASPPTSRLWGRVYGVPLPLRNLPSYNPSPSTTARPLPLCTWPTSPLTFLSVGPSSHPLSLTLSSHMSPQNPLQPASHFACGDTEAEKRINHSSCLKRWMCQSVRQGTKGPQPGTYGLSFCPFSPVALSFCFVLLTPLLSVGSLSHPHPPIFPPC